MTTPARFALAHIAGRLAGAASRRLGLGGGTVIAGVVAQAIEPRVRERAFAAPGMPLIAVTGSNGKTTTARLAASALRSAGRRVAINSAGSNMIQGISALALDAVDPLGRPRVNSIVAEVDEGALLAIVDELRPTAIVVTNIVRDQLDRFGELYATAAALERAARSQKECTLVLCADDPLVAGLAQDHPRRRYAGLSLPSSHDRITSAADSIRCPACRTPLEYGAVYLGHMGDWRCPGCGLERPRPDVAVTGLVFEEEGMLITFRLTAGREHQARVPQRGIHVAYDAVLALTAVVAMGVDPAVAVRGFEAATPAWGRLERLDADGRTVLLGLAKNAMSYRTVVQELDRHWVDYDLLIAHASSVVDGEDFGWLWDVEYERLTPRSRPTTVSGDRAGEITNRLAYAGWDMSLVNVVPKLEPAFSGALAATPVGGRLVVIAGYSPLRFLVEHARRHGWTSHFWEH